MWAKNLNISPAITARHLNASSGSPAWLGGEWLTCFPGRGAGIHPWHKRQQRPAETGEDLCSPEAWVSFLDETKTSLEKVTERSFHYEDIGKTVIPWQPRDSFQGPHRCLNPQILKALCSICVSPMYTLPCTLNHLQITYNTDYDVNAVRVVVTLYYLGIMTRNKGCTYSVQTQWQ